MMVERHDRIPPKSKAMLICDQVIVERDTNKVSVIGSHNYIAIWRGVLPPFCVFLKLTECNAMCDVTFEFHDLRDDLIVSRLGPQMVQFTDRLEAVELVASWNEIQIEHEGAYDVVVLGDGQEIDRHRLEVFFEEEKSDEETHE